jgi:hypothetical protein
MKRTPLRRIAGIAVPALTAGCIALLLSDSDAQGDSTVSVTVNPPTPTVVKGGSKNFSAMVEVTGGAADTVTWSLEGNLAADTTIMALGGTLEFSYFS